MMQWLIRIMIPIALFFLFAGCASQEQPEAKETSEVRSTHAAGAGEKRVASDGATTGRPYAPDQILVRFRNGIEAQEVERIQAEAGLQILKVASAPDLYLMKITDGCAVEDMLVRLKKYPEIVYAEPNYVRTLKGN
jgi:hypothetical protein